MKPSYCRGVETNAESGFMSQCPPYRKPNAKNIVVEALRFQLKVLDEEYYQSRKELLDAIKQHGGDLISEVKEPSGLNGSKKALDLKIRSISDAINAAIADIDGELTLDIVRDYIREKFPHIYERTNPKSIGARLWEACDDGLIEVVSPGRGGHPNIYTRKKVVN